MDDNRKCANCHYSEIGENNFPVVGLGDIVDMPDYELTCTHPDNWRPSRGEMLVDMDYHCSLYQRK